MAVGLLEAAPNARKIEAAASRSQAYMRSKCCYLEGGRADGARCPKDAEWTIYYDSTDPHVATDACTDHVGALLSDSPEHRIFPHVEVAETRPRRGTEKLPPPKA